MAPLYHANQKTRPWSSAPARQAALPEPDPLAARLRHSLVRDELAMRFKALVDTTTHALIGVHGLLHWQTPELGTVSPDALRPIAEQSGLIHAVTLCSLNLGLSQLREWQVSGDDFRLLLSLSPYCLEDATFHQRVAVLLKAWELRPSCLALVLSDRTALVDWPEAIHTLQKLEKLGVMIVLDGFDALAGTWIEQAVPAEQFYERWLISPSTTSR